MKTKPRVARVCAVVIELCTLAVFGFCSGNPGEDAIIFQTDADVRPRFAVLNTSSGTSICYVTDSDGTLRYDVLSGSDGGQPTSSVTVSAGIVGEAHPTLTEWNDLLLASFHDQSQREIHLAVSPDAGMSWNAGSIAGVQDANGWHDIAVADGVLHLFYAAGRQGTLMHAFLDVSGDHFAATDVAVVDDGAVSKGGANMSHRTLGDELFLVYNGAYDIPGQGKTLKLLRMDASGDNPRVEEVDGPACSVGNHAALVAVDNRLSILSVDKSGPQLYVIEGQPDQTISKTALGDFENGGPFSASDLWLSDDSLIAYLQQWPRIIRIAIDPPASTASPVELFVGKRAGDEHPDSDLEVVEVDGSRLVFFFDPAERRIRAVRDFESAAE